MQINKNQDTPSQGKKKFSICSAFYFRSDFLLCLLPAPWKALNSKSRGQSFTQKLREGEVFPKQGTAGRLHHSYESAVTLECVNRHISLLFLTATCRIWLLQIPQDFLRSSNTTSCLLVLSFCRDLLHKNLKHSEWYEKHTIYVLFIQSLSIF